MPGGGNFTHMNLLDILSQIQMGSHGEMSMDELHMANQIASMSKATPRAIVESLPVRTITEVQI